MAKKKEVETFYFVDTRENAKSEKPFGIHNADVAKAWIKDFNNGEGPFKPVNGDDVKFNLNHHDLKAAKQKEGSAEPTIYDDMVKDDLKAELEAREIEFEAKATKPELIALLVADDNK